MSNSESIVSPKSLETLWQTVRTNPSDFVGWTLLLQYCEHMQNIDSIREAFNGFLSNYPFCYIYWRKFAEYEYQMSEQSSAFDVLERAVNAFPISIDIWIYFIQLYIKSNKSVNEIINLFDRAIKLCGNDYNSSELWSLYLNWLTTTRQDLSEVTALYDKLLTIATKHLEQHFENFSAFVNQNNPICILNKNEYNTHCNEYSNIEINFNNYKQHFGDEEQENMSKILFIRKKIIERRKSVFEITLKEREERMAFEDNIKRPYFHVNPLDIHQLDNWMKYLNWEIDRNIHSNVIFLFERCLVSCALYEHMWIRYSNYLIDKRYEMIRFGKQFLDYFDINAIRDVFRRATQIHTRKSFKIHNLWSLFEEREGNFDEALNILAKYETENSHSIQSTLYKINLFHRRGDLNEVHNQFNTSIEKFIDCPKLCSHLSIKYSRFLFKVAKDANTAVQVIHRALQRHPNNYVLYLRLIDIEYQKEVMDVFRIEQLFNDMIASNESIDVKISMTQRKLEFMQDFGFNCQKIQSTITQIQDLMHGFSDQLVTDFNSKSAKRFKFDNQL